MRQQWMETQFIIISMDEMFCWWDRLDALKDSPEKAFDLFTEFLEECEDQLEWNCDFVDKMKDDYVPIDIDTIDDLFEDTTDKERKKQDIPFLPRLNF